MPLIWKIDVLAALKEVGYSSYRLQKEHILADSTLHKLRHGQMVSSDNIARICGLLHCKPGDILDYEDE